jgi:DNA-binding NarL/FixJ family response regulator
LGVCVLIAGAGRACTRLERHLLAAGFEVMTVPSPAEALASLHPSIDVVVLDLDLPTGNPFELLLHLRKHHPNIKVIAASRANTGATLDMARQLGAALTLEKALGLELFVAAVQRVLNSGPASIAS